ncbi:zinc-dependent metalloprotease [Trueperella pyogenes]|uniref:zinc-dependent metalloprotease n=1 Tax=Trueperella pyogenes TaxID=1661 RepID=UPI0032479F45
MVNHEKVYRFARMLAGGGPADTPAQARALVADLRTQALRAPDIVADATGLMGEQSPDVKVVDRPTWAAAAAVWIDTMLPGKDVLDTFQGSLVLSAVSTKVLGQFDPFAEPARLYLVAPNVSAFRAAYDLDRRDLSLWVAVHEFTHAVQFAAAPWLRGLLMSKASELCDALGEDSAHGLLDDVTAVMSLLEGHAEYVMNNVPITHIRSRQRIVDAMAAQRAAANPVANLLLTRLGLPDKRRQYAAGESFVAGVVDRRGMEFFNRVWQRPENLPTQAELSDPDAWIERV